MYEKPTYQKINYIIFAISLPFVTTCIGDKSIYGKRAE